MSVTIIDVAKHAGVSKSTVSLVLQDSQSIPSHTKARVRKAISELGYVPNMNARGLTTKKTNNIGIVIMNQESPKNKDAFEIGSHQYQFDILDGIPLELESTDYGMLLERYCAATIESNGELPRCVQSNRVDGVIILGGAFNDMFVSRLKETQVPVVIVGSNNPNFDCVITDHYRSAYEMMERLIDAGHRRICFLDCPVRYESSILHKQAFDDCLARYQSELGDCRIINTAHNNGASSFQAMRELWESGYRPDSIVGANGMTILGAIRYLSKIRVQVPEDISLVAHEDSILTSYSVPPVSSMDVYKELMGGKACKLLLKRLSGDQSERIQLITPVSYVDRGSIINRKPNGDQH